MADRLRFGVFVAPYHPIGQNPTLAMHRDLDLIAAVDRLGYDEAWVGEHHSGGFEIIGSPEVFIGVASQRAPRLRLGTGVIGTSYHNPLWVAERMVLLDHLTRGRVMLGLGPGGLPTDGEMVGVSMSEVRDLHAEAVRCIVALLRGETVTSKTSMWTLNGARLQLRPYSDPCFDVAVSAVASPSGPRLAGEHGLAMLSIGATRPEGFAALAGHWGLAEERAAQFGQVVDRRTWRLAGFFHVAETRAQAEREVAYGIGDWFDYYQRVASVPQVAVGDAATVPEMIATIRESGLGVIGTVDEAIEQVEGLVAQTGGFGTYLAFARVGGPGRDAAQLRAVRPPRDAPVPGPHGGVPGGRPHRHGPAPPPLRRGGRVPRPHGGQARRRGGRHGLTTTTAVLSRGGTGAVAGCWSPRRRWRTPSPRPPAWG